MLVRTLGLSLECGYAASAVCERIYAGASGCGILLYTSSAGSEGTLGGLVDVGPSIEEHLSRAVDLGRLCSNDPAGLLITDRRVATALRAQFETLVERGLLRRVPGL